MKNFLFAASIDVMSHPYIDFPKNIVIEHQGRKVSGSGIACYPGDGNAALVIKDPKSFADIGRPSALDSKETFSSSIFMMHFNGASWNPTTQDTEPYTRIVGKKDWVWMHQGALDMPKLRKKHNQYSDNFYEPLGNTDSELAFCIILNRVLAWKVKKLSDIGWDKLHDWFKELNQLGSANFFLSDGTTLVIYRGLDAQNALYKHRIKPPYESIALANADAGFTLDFRKEANNLRTVYAFSTLPVSLESKEMKKGQMVVAKKGVLKWNSHSENRKYDKPVSHEEDTPPAPQKLKQGVEPVNKLFTLIKPDYSVANEYINMQNQASRVMRVTHETIYNYSEPIEKSEHTFRMIPMSNRFQQPLEYSFDVSVPGRKMMYRDVFNNDVIHMNIDQPYTELKIKSQSIVRVHKVDSDDFSDPLRNTTIPAAWMPWQRQMMEPFLLPQELPETQLRELNDYAMSFVERNDHHLFETLCDMNRTIYEDYTYKTGSTTLETTAFEVYFNRQGVCQDFANLLICMARLLNIPARYRAGYIYTGGHYDNKHQSDATHAWAELYIPYMGWRGFDPTNGKLVDLDYVRVAIGRNFVDATPTAGTIYKGGGDETLTVTVKTEVIEG